MRGDCFSALQRAENSSISSYRVVCAVAVTVSVLFSEPKIPQYIRHLTTPASSSRFSALQRAENSSISPRAPRALGVDAFQCSSASRKFLNVSIIPRKRRVVKFQCSSASRKFLNAMRVLIFDVSNRCFSALQRAENSSICRRKQRPRDDHRRFSALQRAENSSIGEVAVWGDVYREVSVLFSEPKIPQLCCCWCC